MYKIKIQNKILVKNIQQTKMSNVYTPSISTGKTVVQGNLYLGVDASGNFHNDSSNNTASLQAVLVRAETVSANTIYATNLSYQNIDLSGSDIIAQDLTVNGTTQLNILNISGPVVSSSSVTANSVSTRTLTTPGGFSVDSSGRVVSSSISTKTLATPAGFSIDASGRMVVPGITQLNQLTANGNALFNKSVDVEQGLSVRGGAYINKEYTDVLTVGDGNYGNGVTMKSAGTTLNVTGITQDLSGTVFPVSVNVNGSVVASSVSAGPVSATSVSATSVSATSVSATSLSTPSGFSVDSSGRMVVPGISVLNAATVNGNALFNESVNIKKGAYIGGGAYIDKEYTNVLTVGDSSNGNGVTMKSSGTTMNVTGITQDLSGTVFPVSVNVNGSVVASSMSSGPVSATTVSATTISTKSLSTPAGFSVDTSGRMVVPGITQLNQLTANGNALFNKSVDVEQGLSVRGGAYINKEYTDVLTVGDGNYGNGVTMKSSGTTLNVTGITQDLSATVFPVSVNINGAVVTSSVSTGAIVSSSSVSAKTVSTPGGFSVDASGAVVAASVSTGAVVSTSLVTGPISTAAGFVVDVSANVVVPGDLIVGGTSLFNDSAAFDSSLYVGDGLYSANEYASRLTVGNGIYENGVTMESSGTTLNVFGVTQDTSAILFPINVNVNGGLGVQNSYKFNVFTDTSTNKYINIDSSNTTVPTLGTQVPDYSMPIYINGVAYLINLKKL